MSRNRNQSAATRRLQTALVVALGVITPVAAQARSLVCAPDNRGCHYTRASCKDVNIPKTWTCKAALTARPRDGRIVRGADGRIGVVAGGTTTYLLSDALEARLAPPSEEEILRLVSSDRGSVSDRTLQEFAKELDLPVVTQEQEIRKVIERPIAPAAATKR